MSVLMIPPDDPRPYPTLGPEVAAWMTTNLAFGPGDLRGEPYELDDEDRAFVYRMYEVHPPDHKGACRFERGRCVVGNGTCGRRRFNSAMLMIRKGAKKSERAGALAAVELARDGPVRCDGFRRVDGVWQPVGRPVTDPYIPIVAYTEKQAEDTAFSSLYVMLSEGAAADHFDIGLTRIMRAAGDGKAEALASAPDARDGGRTTFQIKEEAHRWVLPRQLEADVTMTANLSKRPIADPWELYPTTAYQPGQGSLAEKLHEGARKLEAEGADAMRRSRMFFFRRWADESIDIGSRDGLLEAIEDASGPVLMRMTDPDRIAAQWDQADANVAYLNRVWLGRLDRNRTQAFDVERWKTELVLPREVDDGALVVLGFHGARYWDAAALVATEIETGFQWPLFIDERPGDWPDGRAWEVDNEAVDAAMATAFERFTVWKAYVNPDRWESYAATWSNTYGEDRVLAWRTNAWTHMSRATRAFDEAIRTGEIHHDGDPRFTAHIGAAYRRPLSLRDDDGHQLWVPIKERDDSPFPINAALAGIISWQARLDALKAGALEPVVWTAA